MKVWTLLLLAGAVVVHAVEKEKAEKKSEAEPESAAAADEGKGKRAWFNPYMGGPAGFPALHPGDPFVQHSSFMPGHLNEALYTQHYPHFAQHPGFHPNYQHGYYTDVYDPRYSQRFRPWMRPFGYFGTGNINLAQYYGLRQAGSGAGQRFNQGFRPNLRPDAVTPDQSASNFFPQFSNRPDVIDTAAPRPGFGGPDVIDTAAPRPGFGGPDVIDTAAPRPGFGGPDVIDTAAPRPSFGRPDVIDTAGQRFGSDVIDTVGHRLGPDVIDTAGQRFGPDVIDTAGHRLGPDVIDTAGQRFGPDVIDTAGQRFGPDVIDTAAPELNPQFTPGQFQPPPMGGSVGGRVFDQGGASFQGGSATAGGAPNQFQPGSVGGDFGAGGGAGSSQAFGLQDGPFQSGQGGDSFGAGQFGGGGLPLPTGTPTPAGPVGSPTPGSSPAGFGGPPGFDVSAQSGPPYNGQPLAPVPTSPTLDSTSGPDVIDTGANPTLAPSASEPFFNTVGVPGSSPFGGGGFEPDIIDRASVPDWSNIPVSLPRVGFESVDDGQNSESTGVVPASTKVGSVAIFTSDSKMNKPLSPPSSGKPSSTPAGPTQRQDLISSQTHPSSSDSSNPSMRTSATKRKVLDKTNALKPSN